MRTISAARRAHELVDAGPFFKLGPSHEAETFWILYRWMKDYEGDDLFDRTHPDKLTMREIEALVNEARRQSPPTTEPAE